MAGEAISCVIILLICILTPVSRLIRDLASLQQGKRRNRNDIVVQNNVLNGLAVQMIPDDPVR